MLFVVLRVWMSDVVEKAYEKIFKCRYKIFYYLLLSVGARQYQELFSDNTFYVCNPVTLFRLVL